MRIHWLLVLAFVISLGISVPALAGPTRQSCAISEIQQESFDENSLMLVKVLGLVNTPGSAIDDPRTAGIYQSLLMSTRHYHEEMREDLPSCAQALNTAMIDVIAASQDVVGLKLAQDANPDQVRYEQRIRQATSRLNDVWADFFEISNSINLS